MDREQRIESVNLFMEKEFTEKIRAKAISDRLWPSMIALTEGADVHRPFGYSAAQYFSYDDRWSFFYCPDVIVDTTIELEDEQFSDWLRYIRAHVSAHTTLDTTSEDDVESQVYSVLPESRDLVGKVHDLFFPF